MGFADAERQRRGLERGCNYFPNNLATTQPYGAEAGQQPTRPGRHRPPSSYLSLMPPPVAPVDEALLAACRRSTGSTNSWPTG